MKRRNFLKSILAGAVVPALPAWAQSKPKPEDIRPANHGNTIKLRGLPDEAIVAVILANGNVPLTPARRIDGMHVFTRVPHSYEYLINARAPGYRAFSIRLSALPGETTILDVVLIQDSLWT